LVEHLNKISVTYSMEMSAEKTKVMTNNANGISTDIIDYSKKLKTVHSFKYLGTIVTDQGSKSEIPSRTAQTMAALSKLRTIWSDRNILLSTKIRLVISIFLYTCELWTLTARGEGTGHRDEMLSETTWHLQ